MFRTIARQVLSQSRQAAAHAFISGMSNLSHSAAHAAQAAAHDVHEKAISELCRAIIDAERPQKAAQSEESSSAFPWPRDPSMTSL
jgi:hypothetical protein